MYYEALFVDYFLNLYLSPDIWKLDTTKRLEISVRKLQKPKNPIKLCRPFKDLGQWHRMCSINSSMSTSPYNLSRRYYHLFHPHLYYHTLMSNDSYNPLFRAKQIALSLIFFCQEKEHLRTTEPNDFVKTRTMAHNSLAFGVFFIATNFLMSHESFIGLMSWCSDSHVILSTLFA